jgi:hypothetical protein
MTANCTNASTVTIPLQHTTPNIVPEILIEELLEGHFPQVPWVWPNNNKTMSIPSYAPNSPVYQPVPSLPPSDWDPNDIIQMDLLTPPPNPQLDVQMKQITNDLPHLLSIEDNPPRLLSPLLIMEKVPLINTLLQSTDYSEPLRQHLMMKISTLILMTLLRPKHFRLCN